MVPRTGRLVLPSPSRERLSCSQMVMSRGFTPPTTPRTADLWVSPSCIPFPKRPTKGWLMERCRVLPQRPGSHSVPSSPDEDIIRGLRSEPLHQKARRPDNWCQPVDPRGCPSSPPGQCKSPQARIQQPYVQPSQAPNSLIRVQSSESFPVMEMKNRYCT